MTAKLLAAGMIAALLAGSAVYFGASTADESRVNISAPKVDAAGFFGNLFDRPDTGDDDVSAETPNEDGETAPLTETVTDESGELAVEQDGVTAPDMPSNVTDYENAEEANTETVDLDRLGTDVIIDPDRITELSEIEAADGVDVSVQTEQIAPTTPRIRRDAREQRGGQRPLITPIDVLIDQADRISIDAVQDDAYFNILDYALAQDRIEVTEELIGKMSTPDLRDLARRNVGLTHAVNGRTDAAFAILEDLEVEEMSDPIRLEIIRKLSEVR